MIKKIVLILILIILSVGGLFAYKAYTYPDKMYTSWIRGDGFDEWFFIPNYDANAFNNHTRHVERNLFKGSEADSVWKTFHVSDVLLPLPFRHPLYSVVPTIQDMGASNQPQIGFEIMTSQKKKIFSIQFLPKKDFKYKDNKQKLFKIPIFKQNIDSISDKVKWRDLFEMNFQDQPKSIKEMVYKLYILDQRMAYLSKNTKTFGYIPENEAAVVEYLGKDKDFKNEYIVFLRGGTLHSFLISTRIGEPEAKRIRGRILKDIKIEPDSENMSRAIYEEFKALPYQQQISNDGLIYLFSAWSHTPEDKEFFRVMIQFLERGTDNFAFLEPLYAYAYARFGSSFSRYDSHLKEKAEQEFRRKLEEEEKRDAKDLLNKKIEDINLNDLSEQERIDYQLKKAREKKANSSDDKVIIVD
ncbi:MAG: hypothetical protein ACOYL6_07805 [Bacteriovoracaceae bacterium]